MRRRGLAALFVLGLVLGLASVEGASAVVPSAAVGLPDAHPGAGPANDRRVIATTAGGREIVARHYGDRSAPVQMVVIGQMHGNESGGRRVLADLVRRQVPAGVGVWLVPTMNPDGAGAGTRANGRGVDLNRNFPYAWQRRGDGTSTWSGLRAASEPETVGMTEFLAEIRPAAVLSFHQAYDVVDISHPRSRPAGRQLAHWMGERAEVVGCSGRCHGTLTQWVDARLRAIALTVELDDRVSVAEARRAAAAVLRLGTWLGR